jgi:hypothetical protein
MTAGGIVQRTAEYLIRRACRRLPDDIRDERCREWTSELPAILHDPAARFAPLRSARALFYAADASRSARSLRRAARGPVVLTRAALILRLIAGVSIYLSVVALTIALILVFHPDNAWPLALLFVAGAGFVTLCLTSLARTARVRYLPKWGWAVFCAVSVPLGGIIYLSIGRVRAPSGPCSGQARHADASGPLP